MVINTFKRYEKKYLITKTQYTTLCKKIEPYMEADFHCKENGTYTIFNIYYDTDQHDVIRHSISKPFYKEKLRLRSYTIPKSLTDTVFLELKKKISGVVSKRRATMTLQEAYDFINKGIKPVADNEVNKQVIEEIAYFLKRNQVHANVFIRYERNAFFSKENREFRLTFDRNIETRRFEVALEKGDYGTPIQRPDVFLMEVKILGSIPMWFTEVMSELEIYPARFSKYGTEYEYYCKNHQEKIIKFPSLQTDQAIDDLEQIANFY